MAKAKSSDEVILEGLRKALAGLPELLPLTGTKSLFTAKQADLAQRAVTEGLLTTLKKQVKSAKTTKTIEVGILTEAGALKATGVSGTSELKSTLELLRSVVEKIGKPSSPPDPATIVAAIQSSTATCVNTINTAFAGLRDEVLRAVAPSGGSAIDPAPILAAISTALGKVEPTKVMVPVIVDQEPAVDKPTTDPVKVVADEIVSFVNATAQERTVGCDFVELFEHLRSKHPNLTIGIFHDALRALDEAGRIRLKDWPRMQDDIPRPELALFISHTVMYHVQSTR